MLRRDTGRGLVGTGHSIAREPSANCECAVFSSDPKSPKKHRECYQHFLGGGESLKIKWVLMSHRKITNLELG